MTTATQITELRETFGKLHTMSPDGMIYRKLCKILDQADDEALTAAFSANIKWVSPLAMNRMIRRGLPLN